MNTQPNFDVALTGGTFDWPEWTCTWGNDTLILVTESNGRDMEIIETPEDEDLKVEMTQRFFTSQAYTNFITWYQNHCAWKAK